MICKNCGYEYTGDACPICGQISDLLTTNRFAKKMGFVLKLIGYGLFGVWSLFCLLIIPQNLSVAITLLSVSWLFFIAVHVLWKRAHAVTSQRSFHAGQSASTAQPTSDVPEALTVAGNRVLKVMTVPGKPITPAVKKLADKYKEKEKRQTQIAYNRANGIPMCPKCRSAHIQALSPNSTLGFVSDVSVYMLPPSKKYTEMVCLNCGHRWSIKSRR